MKNELEFKNAVNLKQFAAANKSAKKINESVELVDDVWFSRTPSKIPSSLVKAYYKKVLEASGVDKSRTIPEAEVADRIKEYILSKYMTIENLPVNIILGDKFENAAVIVQPTVQPVQEVPAIQTPTENVEGSTQQPSTQGDATQTPQPSTQTNTQQTTQAPAAQETTI